MKGGASGPQSLSTTAPATPALTSAIAYTLTRFPLFGIGRQVRRVNVLLSGTILREEMAGRATFVTLTSVVGTPRRLGRTCRRRRSLGVIAVTIQTFLQFVQLRSEKPVKGLVRVFLPESGNVQIKLDLLFIKRNQAFDHFTPRAIIKSGRDGIINTPGLVIKSRISTCYPEFEEPRTRRGPQRLGWL